MGMTALRRMALAALCTAPLAVGAATPLQSFAGRWDVTLKTPQRAYSSWLEIRAEHGQPRVRMVGRWGHARWLPQASLSDGHLRFVSPKEEEGRTDGDMVFDGALDGGELRGTTTGPDGATWTWRATRAPALKAAYMPKWGTPVSLFDGRDARAWTPVDTAAKQWRVADGVLTSPGAGTDLRSVASFGDFKLHLEFNCVPGANSGVYLRGRYELQIENDREPEAANMRTAGIYGYLAPSPAAPRTPGVWQSYDITLVGRYVTVKLNGQTVIDRREIPGITGGALDSREGEDGPLVLQGSEDGQVSYRNIVITPAVKP
ncbi:DUF1080 domain-containing protein [Massilia terrae]|uniref:DUF1080 domain-containing protein n=1 Tax=Massilia terrae TaxID=1811224 RepID=A0ABT2CTG1_9BURK|nr:DUF1080 domain-containing protein [Massilia terrae]MCS0657124.1 DUF1080 domain-containing protein [Massilia terrae]